MTSAHPTQWTPKRLELLKWFREHAAPLAGAYEGAVRLIDDGDFPGRLHFIAHAVRDIADRLPFALDPHLDGGRVQYENALDEIEKEWPKLAPIEASVVTSTGQDNVTIEWRLGVMIDSLVRQHRERRRKPSASELLFRFLMRREPTTGAVNERLVSDFKKMRAWFMSLAHLPAKEPRTVDESELQSRFCQFEGMLHSFVGEFFTGTTEIDEILRQANS